MIKVPTLEEQRATQQFQYDRIMLLLFSQTKFDKVLKPNTHGGRFKKFRKEILAGFKSKTKAERYDIVANKMPERLRNRFLGEAADPEDKIKVWSHRCKLRKTTDEDAERWMCKGVVLDGRRVPCLDKGMKSEKNSKFAQGWMCPRGDFCQDKPADGKEGAHTQYVLCIKCLRVNKLIH